MPNAFVRYAALVALALAVGFGAHLRGASPARPQAQTPAAGGSGLPDILGIHPGMTAQQAYGLLKAIDPGHTVTLDQWTIPQLYKDKPIVFSMNPATTGPDNQIVVSITLPPNPQVVWQVRRSIGRFTSTKPNVLNSLFHKYGTPWNPNPGQPVNSDLGELYWFFNEQGKPVNPPTAPADVLAFKNCLNAVMSPWNMPFLPTAPGGANNTVAQGQPRTTVEPMPPPYDPSKNPQCNNLIRVHAEVNQGTVRDNDLAFYMEIDIADFTAQHRTNMALNDKLNAIVQQGAQQQRNNASQQSVPKL
jgi:hypothetical protein